MVIPVLWVEAFPRQFKVGASIKQTHLKELSLVCNAMGHHKAAKVCGSPLLLLLPGLGLSSEKVKILDKRCQKIAGITSTLSVYFAY